MSHTLLLVLSGVVIGGIMTGFVAVLLAWVLHLLRLSDAIEQVTR